MTDFIQAIVICFVFIPLAAKVLQAIEKGF